jgi:uncharacterized membrane protein
MDVFISSSIVFPIKIKILEAALLLWLLLTVAIVDVTPQLTAPMTFHYTFVSTALVAIVATIAVPVISMVVVTIFLPFLCPTIGPLVS